jgi:hypothetical protein
MKIGSAIALIVIGAILILAVQDTIGGVDLTMVGYIFVAGGVLGLILAILTSRPREPKPLNRSSETRTLNDPASGETIRRTEVRED